MTRTCKLSNYVRTLDNGRWVIKCTQCGKEYDIYPCNKRKGTICKQCLLKNRNTTHGESRTRLYGIWTDMKKRCDNKNHIMFKYYGGKGIKYEDSWSKFEPFRDWAKSNGYSDDLELDRKDGELSYCESNCRWTTREVQMQNTRRLFSHNKSGYRGVHWDKRKNKWIVQISVSNKKIHIGAFNDLIEGAKAYDNYVIANNLSHTKNFT